MSDERPVLEKRRIDVPGLWLVNDESGHRIVQAVSPGPLLPLLLLDVSVPSDTAAFLDAGADVYGWGPITGPAWIRPG